MTTDFEAHEAPVEDEVDRRSCQAEYVLWNSVGMIRQPRRVSKRANAGMARSGRELRSSLRHTLCDTQHGATRRNLNCPLPATIPDAWRAKCPLWSARDGNQALGCSLSAISRVRVAGHSCQGPPEAGAGPWPEHPWREGSSVPWSGRRARRPRRATRSPPTSAPT